MTAIKIGRMVPRYSFISNPHADVRVSKCPRCQRVTHARKFAFFIIIEEWGPMVMGKTCRYCTPCELIVVHQDELEAELANSFASIAPHAIGNKYYVVGTVEKDMWKKGLRGGNQMDEILEHLADFKERLDLHVEPGGWYPADAKRERPVGHAGRMG